MSTFEPTLTDATNRVADAIFSVATQMRFQSKLQERAVSCAEQSLEAQKANLAVTRALEAQLIRKIEGDGGHA